MKSILLIDADSKIPNIALMKLSAHYKSKGDSVELLRLNIPYYPNKKKKQHNITIGYDKVYCSIIFEGSKGYVAGTNIIFGGTGFSLDIRLPAEIESMSPDYTLYPENNISYGFISRGCIRKCKFCKVHKKEGNIKQVSYVDAIVRHKKVRFLDNNFLALSNHKVILRELISKNIKCQFYQGLDIRLVDAENSLLLSKLNYIGEYVFAFDDWEYLIQIEKAFKLLSWKKPWQFKFFVYIHPEMPFCNIIKRVKWLGSHCCLPYIMRDITCWDSIHNDFYIDLASWCNQVSLFKKMSFKEFLIKRHTCRNRLQKINKSLMIYQQTRVRTETDYKPRIRVRRVQTKDEVC